jgi:hypothetical protein
VAVLLLTIWVWQKVAIVRKIESNERLRAEVAARAEQVHKLNDQVSKLGHRLRITEIASNNLGMVATRPAQMRPFYFRIQQEDRTHGNFWDRIRNSFKRLPTASTIMTE